VKHLNLFVGYQDKFALLNYPKKEDNKLLALSQRKHVSKRRNAYDMGLYSTICSKEGQIMIIINSSVI
jgi:hypothetical protein